MSDDDWNSGFVRCLGLRLAGDLIDDENERGEPVVGETLLLLLNGHWEPIDFTLPETKRGHIWDRLFDTADPQPEISPVSRGGQVHSEGPLDGASGHQAARGSEPDGDRASRRSRPVPGKSARAPLHHEPATSGARPDLTSSRARRNHRERAPCCRSSLILRSRPASSRPGIDLPESTYRLQFHAGFTFRDAIAIVPYLRELGITHCYASPYLKAAAGSTHGYDVVDFGTINPEIGSAADFDAWIERTRAARPGADR